MALKLSIYPIQIISSSDNKAYPKVFKRHFSFEENFFHALSRHNVKHPPPKRDNDAKLAV